MLKVVCASVLFLACVVSARRSLALTSRSNRCALHSEITALIDKGHCRPVDQPVPVPVPDGYVSVTPSVVLLPRCEGLACSSQALTCIPHPEHIVNISIAVYAYTAQRRRECIRVPVVTHEGCMCGCPTTCPQNQVLRSDLCGCECDREQQAKCESRQRLWDPSGCSCLCPIAQAPRCSSGQVYIKELCRCENY